MQPFNPHVYEEAIELPVIHAGDPEEIEDGVVMYSLQSGYRGVSYVVKNNGTRTLQFTHDCRKSKNLQSNQSSLVNLQTIPPGEAKVTLTSTPIAFMYFKILI